MANIIKAMKLDFDLVKVYVKAICFYITNSSSVCNNKSFIDDKCFLCYMFYCYGIWIHIFNF